MTIKFVFICDRCGVEERRSVGTLNGDDAVLPPQWGRVVVSQRRFGGSPGEVVEPEKMLCVGCIAQVHHVLRGCHVYEPDPDAEQAEDADG